MISRASINPNITPTAIPFRKDLFSLSFAAIFKTSKSSSVNIGNLMTHCSLHREHLGIPAVLLASFVLQLLRPQIEYIRIETSARSNILSAHYNPYDNPLSICSTILHTLYTTLSRECQVLSELFRNIFEECVK